jgi:hypothetical protein
LERIEESIEINAPPEAVFAVVSDLCQRAHLNPHWTIVSCEPLDGAMHAGARYRFVSLRRGTRTEHVSRVAVYEPPSHLVLHSEIHRGLEIELTVHAMPTGSRLTHAESFERLPSQPKPTNEPRSFLTILRTWLMFEQEGYAEASAEEVRATLRTQIGREIHAWLTAIKHSIERGEVT